MKDTGKRGLVIGLMAMTVAVTTFLISEMNAKEPEKVKFSALPEKTSAEVTYVTSTLTKVTTSKRTTAAVTTEKATETATEPLMVNINTAGVDELCSLDGIGESKAAAVIAYRAEHGMFHSIEEIVNVSGIGEDTFQAIRGHIYVDDPTYPTTETVAETAEASTAAETELSTEHKPTLEELAPIDINKADAEELMLLPHVDEEVAEAIIRLREDIGGYSHPYELLYIDKLTQKQVAEIVVFVTVGQ